MRLRYKNRPGPQGPTIALAWRDGSHAAVAPELQATITTIAGRPEGRRRPGGHGDEVSTVADGVCVPHPVRGGAGRRLAGLARPDGRGHHGREGPAADVGRQEERE